MASRARTPLSAPIRGAGETDVGSVRDRNEDVVLVEPDLGLYAVFDGMGGSNAGDVAARMASERIADYVREKAHLLRRNPARVLERALHAASDAVIMASVNTEHLHGMRTTVVACLVVDPVRAVIAHVGDSRAYLLRDGELAQLTRDHSLVQELVDEGKLSPRGARRSRRRNLVTRAVGRTSVLLEVDMQELALEPGDRLLLCSDGLHGYTPARLIRRVLAGDGTPEQLALSLVDLALSRPAPDNVSAVVISVDGGGAPATQRSSSARVRTIGARSRATKG
jgi:protein phosphatase